MRKGKNPTKLDQISYSRKFSTLNHLNDKNKYVANHLLISFFFSVNRLLSDTSKNTSDFQKNV